MASRSLSQRRAIDGLTRMASSRAILKPAVPNPDLGMQLKHSQLALTRWARFQAISKNSPVAHAGHGWRIGAAAMASGRKEPPTQCQPEWR